MSAAEAGLKAIEIALGVTLIYLRFFLYESEEGRLQNALVELWVRISDRADTAKKRLLRLLDETAGVSLKFFDRLFGCKLLSFRAFAVAGTLAIASTCMTNAWEAQSASSRLDQLAVAVAFAIIATIPALIRKVWVAWVRGIFAVSAIVIGCVSLAVAVAQNQNNNELAVAIAITSILVSPVVDFVWLAACRLATEQALKHHRISSHIGAILTGVAVTYWTSVMPVVARDAAFSLAASLSNPVSAKFMLLAGLFLNSLVFTRFFVCAISLIQLAALLVAITHWIIWPILSRVVYAAERFKVFKERTLFGTCGSALLFHAAGGATWALHTMKAFGLEP